MTERLIIDRTACSVRASLLLDRGEMPNPATKEQQLATLRTIWERYRAYANTSARLKGEQGGWRRVVLWASVAALLAVPFGKTFEKYHLNSVSTVLTISAAVLFALIAWLNENILGDDSDQPWVKARQTAEGLKALSFRFLGGVPPFDSADAVKNALEQAQALANAGGTADAVAAPEAEKRIPPAPLTIADYLTLRVADQISFYEKSATDARQANARLVRMGRLISAAVVVFGALGALLAETWREIWAPALGAASTLVTTQMAVSRRRFLVETYSLAAQKLRFARTAFETSQRAPSDEAALVAAVESILASENAGWVQQMLLKPVVPDSKHASPPHKED
jgi:hypothetical protein